MMISVSMAAGDWQEHSVKCKADHAFNLVGITVDAPKKHPLWHPTHAPSWAFSVLVNNLVVVGEIPLSNLLHPRVPTWFGVGGLQIPDGARIEVVLRRTRAGEAMAATPITDSFSISLLEK